MNKIIDLQLFAEANTNLTTDSDLSAEMKTYYHDYLIDIAKPKLVHDQFGQKKQIPANRGNKIEFRKFDNLPKNTVPLSEGITPDGRKMRVTTVTATAEQYGDYVTLSDKLQCTAIDPNVVQAAKIIGAQAGVSLDTITREILNAGTNVQYGDGDGSVSARNELKGKNSSGDTKNYLTVKAVKNAVRTLRRYKAAKIGNYYIGIIHPDAAFDLINDPEWIAPKQYQDTDDLYEGEIGRIAGVRFVETTEAKIWEKATSDNDSVYSTLIIGENAYGVTDVEGMGLEIIVKPLGSGDDPLNQRSTVGWKAMKTAEILLQQNMVRIETTSSYNGDAN